MDNDSPLKAILVVTATALVCSILVTVTAVTLQPIQQGYADLERIRYIVALSGVADSVEQMSELELIVAYQGIDAHLVDLDSGRFDTAFDPRTYDTREAAADAQRSVPVPTSEDVARLGQRSRLMPVYLLRDGDELQRLVLPIYGQGMWSTIYGFIALESDLNTIAGISFYEHAETPGIGDRILNPAWQAAWVGRRVYDEQDTVRLRIIRGEVSEDSPEAAFEIDGLAGATVTANGVLNIIRYWFGPHGYAQFLNNFPNIGDM